MALGLSISEFSDKSSISYSLFNDDGLLLNILNEMQIWYHSDYRKFTFAKKVFLDLLPNLKDILLNKEKNKVLFIEDENNDNEKEFSQLAAGNRVLINMVGDIIIRLSNHQKGIKNINDLEGIVLIDEIELHLHPHQQKQLPIMLSKIFPKIQFIASTHSPIPLLGAPSNSIFINVFRDKEVGICAKKLDIDISNLLPNTILTSPIFGIDELRSSTNTEIKNLNVDEHFDEKLFYEIVKQKIDEYTSRPGWENKIDKSK
jgi:hypothetical protein